MQAENRKAACSWKYCLIFPILLTARSSTDILSYFPASGDFQLFPQIANTRSQTQKWLLYHELADKKLSSTGTLQVQHCLQCGSNENKLLEFSCCSICSLHKVVLKTLKDNDGSRTSSKYLSVLNTCWCFRKYQ